MKNTYTRRSVVLIGILFVSAGCSNSRAIHDWPETHPANPHAEQADPPVKSKTLEITRKPTAKATPSPHQHHEPDPKKGELKSTPGQKHTEEHKK